MTGLNGAKEFLEHHGVQNVDDVIEHFGVKGMKWGVRKKRNGPASDDAARAYASRTRGKQEGVQTLSNKEIQDFLNRVNLESQFSRVTASPTRKALNFVSSILTNTGKQQVSSVVNTQVNKQIKSAMTGQSSN